MTSNIGARYLERRAHMGFQSAVEGASEKKAEELVMSEVKRLFNPEFLNRLDETIVFNALNDNDLLQILDLLVGQMNQNLAQKNISLTLSPEAGKWILEKTCGDRSYGARPLRRALQKYVEDPLSEALIQGEIHPPAVLEVIVENEALNYRPVSDKLVAAAPLADADGTPR
jgi:ATP-dependent Clp protease ATP-binding subunit ClpC